MGSPASDKDAAADEKPQHRVRITKPFYLGKYKVTQEQWQAVMDDGKLASLFTGIRNPSRFKGPTNPVDMVSWQDCQQFLDRLNGRIGAGRVKFQLPTEAQWEYACRAGSTTRYCFGDDAWQLDAYAWYGKNAKGASHPVGEKRSNGWGLHDMYGSQWEWCADWYEQTYYHYLPPPGGWCDPAGPPKGLYRVIRGGSWGSGDAYCRSAVRGKESPGFRNNGVGFRVAMILPGEVPLPVEPKLAQPVASRALWGGRPITRASALEEAPLWNGNTSP
jgi:formylglycine-generating enzyme required for sulfatase activity